MLQTSEANPAGGRMCVPAFVSVSVSDFSIQFLLPSEWWLCEKKKLCFLFMNINSILRALEQNKKTNGR